LPVADGAGVVEEVGSAVEGFTPGDLIATVYIPKWKAGRYTLDFMSLDIRPGMGVIPGQLTEYKSFKVDEIIKMPSHLTAAEAATLPIAAVTAWNALRYGGVKPGSTVLIHGTGGVSLFALQFAKLFGARAIITSSSDEKLSRALQIGADQGVNYVTISDLVEKILELTDGSGVDLVVETIGGQNVEKSLRMLAPEGVLSLVGFLEGTTATIPLIPMNLKRATLVGTSVGSKEDFSDMLAAIGLHKLHPIIDRVFSLSEVKKAFTYLKSRRHLGKIVIDLRETTTIISNVLNEHLV
jgi:NADPH:quinone reductase-like Zn-dependent oxidoreductase